MKRVNKYEYLFVIQGRYTSQWEDISFYDHRREAMRDLKMYRLSEPAYNHRLIFRREPNPEYKDN